MIETKPMSSRPFQAALTLLLLTFAAVATLYATYTPDWQTPDEPAHYNYIRQIAKNGQLPLLQPGDYDQTYLSQLTSERFPPNLPVDAIEYEDHQPPLYYLLAAPVYLLGSGSLLAVRLFSVALGIVVVLGSVLAVQTLLPRHPWLALSAGMFVAFVPQHVAMLAAANNDSLAEAILVLGLWQLLALMQQPTALPRSWSRVALLIGLALLTKTTIYLLAPVAALGLLLAARRHHWPCQHLIRSAAWLVLPTLPFALAWFGRNLAVYGWPDLLGLIRHDTIVEGQLRTADWVAEVGSGPALRQFVRTTFNSFWGQFGWMGVPMPNWTYTLLIVYSAGLLAGLLLAIRTRPAIQPHQRDGLAVLGAVIALAGGAYLYYNLSFVQHQGRYLFPALLPVALLAAGGLWGWWRLVTTWPPLAKIPAWAALIGVLPLPLLAVFALFRFIVPALT